MPGEPEADKESSHQVIQQPESFLDSIGIGVASAEALRQSLAKHPPGARPDIKTERASLDTAVAALESELEELVKLRIRRLVSEDLFVRQQTELGTRRLALVQRRQNLANRQEVFEPDAILTDFLNHTTD